MKKGKIALGLAALLSLMGCQSKMERGDPPMEIANRVDLQRFMGKWYVHGYTPTVLDKDAYNPTETYELGDDGRILTTYEFRKGSFDGKEKKYNPKGRVFDRETNAEWRMTFFGVFTAPYLIVYLSDDYEYTVVGHPNRELAWIMSRDSEISVEQYTALKSELEKRDFDLSKLKRAYHK